MEYIGEEAWIGFVGKLLVYIAFIAAIQSGISYFFAAKRNDDGWRKMGRFFFRIHAASVAGIFITLLSMLIAHKFQYQYVWQHSSLNMEMNYILACMWEGQEGSFLLWMFWHAMIGLFLLRRSGKFEAPVMAIFALVQIFLVSMLLGIYIGDLHIGSSPFLLVREVPDNIGLPWTKVGDYLTNPQTKNFFADGRGLNPLLQNYWMTIHPPTLFLGFALTLVPFAFAIAALWKKEYFDWQKIALPWTYVGIAVLGTGILMGGAWAYEALSFGGFWAWDPVENASLVPWLTLVGAGHVMLIYKIKGRSLFTGFFLSIISFLLILYSTFLTRSGILGETSVHAFTDLGMSGQLVLYLAFFVWLAVMLLAGNVFLRWAYNVLALIFLAGAIFGSVSASTFGFLLVSLGVLLLGYLKFFPKEEKEEALWSREFWMFTGAIVLLVSACQISFFTSIPVVNKFLKIESIHNAALWLFQEFPGGFTQKLASANLAPGGDMVYFYNKWQIPFAVIICFLIGAGQFFKYKQTSLREFTGKTITTFLISLVVAIIGAVFVYFNRKFQLEAADLRDDFTRNLWFGIILIPVALGMIMFSGVALRKMSASLERLPAQLFSLTYVLVIPLLIYGCYFYFDKATDQLTEDSAKGFVLAVWCPLLLFAATFAVLANADYILAVLKGKIRSAGASLAHIGFGLLLLGALVSTSRMQVISRNVSDRDLRAIDSTLTNESNILITQGDTLPMGDYFVAYQGREKEGRNIYYNVDYYEKSKTSKKLEFSFRLRPFIQLNERMGNAAEPDTRHYLHKDVYTHIVQADVSDPKAKKTNSEDWTEPKNTHLKKGDTIALNSAVIVLDSITSDITKAPEELTVGGVFSVYDRDFAKHTMHTSFTVKGNQTIPKEARNDSVGLKLTLWKVYPEDGSFDVYVSEKMSKRRESIVMKAVIFPGINVLWLGCVLMVIGTVIAIINRVRLSRRKTADEA
ncbi:MAG: cytochrome c-type bioproteinis protein CcmF [Bacteroidetes bacterium]|nr:MAG: cytochrome c-type bioproteinis protein CcmF [Bacteroidota bacterium]